MKRASKKKMGKVWIVGAGPGAPDLITERARKVLDAANVVLYDDLVHPANLPYPYIGRFSSRQLLPVGRRAGRTNRQESTERMMIRFARAGKKVVRLKGGDPFVFGRGGEEVEAMRKAGVPCEVIPGVSSATGVATLAGIPLTYRGIAASFTVVTGHLADGKGDREPEWDLLAHSSDTLVIMMGMTAFPRIAARLIKAGKDPATPVAVIRWGTWPMERRWFGTLADGAAGKLPYGTPSAIIIGAVVRLARPERVVPQLPLAGVRVAVTRETGYEERLRRALNKEGVLVSSAPAIATYSVHQSGRSSERRDAAAIAKRIATFDWIVLTSAKASFQLDCFQRVHHIAKEAFARPKYAVIGRATAVQTGHLFSRPAVVAAEASQEGLARSLGDVRGKNILIARARDARTVLETTLSKRGARVTILPLYFTEPDAGGLRRLKGLVSAGEVDVVTFTSGSTVDFSMKALGAAGRRQFKKSVKAASIGPVTSAALRKWGIRPAVQAKTASMEALAAAIVRYYKSHPHARPAR